MELKEKNVATRILSYAASDPVYTVSTCIITHLVECNVTLEYLFSKLAKANL